MFVEIKTRKKSKMAFDFTNRCHHGSEMLKIIFFLILHSNSKKKIHYYFSKIQDGGSNEIKLISTAILKLLKTIFFTIYAG
jgi:hypothetical protein